MVDLSTGEAAAIAGALVKTRKRYKRKPWKPIDHEKFRDTRHMARLTQSEAACLLHVTERTIRLWETGQVAIPYAAYKLLRILTGFELPGEAWAGWSIRGNTLWSPERRAFNASHLSYMWLTFAMARNWQEMVLKAESAQPAGVAGELRASAAAPTLRLVKS